jgi:trk system potassium uptake protein TrkA
MYIIVGGGGEVGYYVTRNLLDQGHEVLLLEKHQQRFQTLSEELGQSVLRGDACEASVLEDAGARRADVILAVTGEDEDNLVICQVAKKRFNVARTIARLNNPRHEALFHKLGIDTTVSPTKAILSLIESELPGQRFAHLITLKRAGLEVVENTVSEISPVLGKKLNEIQLPANSKIFMILRESQPLFPTMDIELQANDEVYAIVQHDGAANLREVFGTI